MGQPEYNNKIYPADLVHAQSSWYLQTIRSVGEGYDILVLPVLVRGYSYEP